MRSTVQARVFAYAERVWDETNIRLDIVAFFAASPLKSFHPCTRIQNLLKREALVTKKIMLL